MKREDRPFFIFSGLWLLFSAELVVFLTDVGAHGGTANPLPHCFICGILWLFLIVPVMTGGKHLMLLLCVEVGTIGFMAFAAGQTSGAFLSVPLSAAFCLAGLLLGFRQRGRKRMT